MATLEGELRKKTTDRARSRGAHWAISCRAIVFGLLLALVAGNVWPMLFLTLRLPLAVLAEASFLALFLWWARGGGPPHATEVARAMGFRRRQTLVRAVVLGSYSRVLLRRDDSCLDCVAIPVCAVSNHGVPPRV